ncbi:MAG: hypothetical protein K0S65_448 [Labilithrix sp.]|nr:hypothetical protein [Labilithrix sp.]
MGRGGLDTGRGGDDTGRGGADTGRAGLEAGRGGIAGDAVRAPGARGLGTDGFDGFAVVVAFASAAVSGSGATTVGRSSATTGSRCRTVGRLWTSGGVGRAGIRIVVLIGRDAARLGSDWSC